MAAEAFVVTITNAEARRLSSDRWWQWEDVDEGQTTDVLGAVQTSSLACTCEQVLGAVSAPSYPWSMDWGVLAGRMSELEGASTDHSNGKYFYTGNWYRSFGSSSLRGREL